MRASPDNFDADLGRKIARQNAVAKLWPLMGYELRSALHKQAVIDHAAANGLPLMADGSPADPDKFGVV